MPFDLSGIETELFRHDKSFWIPLLYVCRELDEDVAVVLDHFEAFETSKESPNSGRIQSKAVVLRPGLARFLDDIQGNRCDCVPVDPGEALEHVFPRGLFRRPRAKIIADEDGTERYHQKKNCQNDKVEVPHFLLHSRIFSKSRSTCFCKV